MSNVFILKIDLTLFCYPQCSIGSQNSSGLTPYIWEKTKKIIIHKRFHVHWINVFLKAAASYIKCKKGIAAIYTEGTVNGIADAVHTKLTEVICYLY